MYSCAALILKQDEGGMMAREYDYIAISLAAYAATVKYGTIAPPIHSGINWGSNNYTLSACVLSIKNLIKIE